ncbi:MAG: VOC family protein [Candidatus Promineifilaceae bacterium]|nr:VOC family protein [Candidatus Promineifilaceae bacterium]
MLIQAIHHAQITIPTGKEAEGRAFYRDILGLPEKQKPDSLEGRGGFWLQVGSHEVHVGTEDRVDRNHTKFHLAYQVDDLDRWRVHLEENGVAVKECVPIPGYHRFEIRDPFGNRIEFIQAVE